MGWASGEKLLILILFSPSRLAGSKPPGILRSAPRSKREKNCSTMGRERGVCDFPKIITPPRALQNAASSAWAECARKLSSATAAERVTIGVAA
ncbi:hypothetical protein G6F60_014133 [Rhizopus arrhizus]|nr:hypothetical protein G6F31_021329 [Rhizopus arrhizus]KAG1250352.1 hypothetical protein G6F65_018770 [Rhizopus arrhizus]KAG1387389.1 hypothetical protein G6F60_014133 [Rhizopus arrhizus]